MTEYGPVRLPGTLTMADADMTEAEQIARQYAKRHAELDRDEQLALKAIERTSGRPCEFGVQHGSLTEEVHDD